MLVALRHCGSEPVGQAALHDLGASLELAICTLCLAGAMLVRVGVAEKEMVTIILDRSQVGAYEKARAET